MWCLTPLLPSSAAPAEHELNPVRFLVAGEISIGRPAKKTGKTGAADLLIHGEGSVSSLHAVLEVGPGGPAAHQGAVYIKDSSKYGTHVRRGGSGEEQRLPAGQRVQLQEGDVLRFGSKCRYQLTAVPLVLAAPASSHDGLAASAAAAGARLAPRCEDAVSHAIAADGEQLSPLLLRALLEGVPLATPQWLAALAAGKAWAGALPDPAAHAAHAPQQLQLPLPPQQQQDQHQRVLELASWQAPAADLLADFVLVFGPACEPDLQAAAATLGAHTQCSPAVDGTAQLASEAAAASGRAALVVAAAADAAGRHQPAHATISEQQLLLAMATGNRAALDVAVEAAAAAAQQVSVAGSEDEAEETEEGEEAPEDDLQPVMPVLPVLATRSRGGSQAGAPAPPPAGQAVPAAGPAPPAPLPGVHASGRGKKRGAATAPAAPSPPPSAAAAAAADDDDDDDDAGAAQQPASKRLKLSPVPARAGAPAAAPSPAAAAATGGGRRSRGAALKAPAAEDAAPTQQQRSSDDVTQACAATNGPMLSQLPLTQVRESVFTAPLIVPSPPCPRATAGNAAAAAAGAGSINYKAFRRKQLGQLQAAALLPGLPPPPALRLVQYDRQYAGADADAFMKDEQARLERLKKADELFNASIRPTKAPAGAAKAGGAPKPAPKPRKPAARK